jgi:lactate dehydrogenase-like 2-hydroxyacid dehydrogenase
VTTAIIGVGHIGSTLAQHLVGASEEFALAALDKSEPEALAEKLGPVARADSVERAIARADTVIFAVWLQRRWAGARWIDRAAVNDVDRRESAVFVRGMTAGAKPVRPHSLQRCSTQMTLH